MLRDCYFNRWPKKETDLVSLLQKLKEANTLPENDNIYSASADPIMKIAIIGISGMGKSTLARRLSKCTGINPVFADSYVWEENWTLADKNKAREKNA